MHIITDKASAFEIRDQLRGTAIAFDFETTSTNWMTANIIGLSIATLNDEWFFVVKDGLTQEGLANVLWTWFNGPRQTLIAHNAAFDMQFLANMGIVPQRPPFDTMGLAQLYNESCPLGLKKLAWLVLDREPRPWDKTFVDWPIEDIAKYGCADARNTYDLATWFLKNIDKNLWPYYYEYMYCLPIVAIAMSRIGWTLDQDAVKEHAEKLNEDIATMRAEICADVPGLENPGSTQQLAVALEQLGATWLKGEKTRTGRKSTGADVLERMTEEDTSEVRAIAKSILDYRGKITLRGHLKGFLASAATDGRIHPNWKIFGTVTGRWACASPNLQNVPKQREGDETEVNTRNWFMASPGNILVVADLAQAEYRVLAGLSGDKRMVAAFAQGLDIHRATAAAIFDKPFDDVTDYERFIGKTTNFAEIYGAGPPRIMSVTGLSKSDAIHILDRAHRAHPEAMRWCEKVRECANLDGVVYTAFGRPRRPLLLQAHKLVYDDPLEEQEPGEVRMRQAGFVNELRKVGLTQHKLRSLPTQQLSRQLRYLKGRGGRQAVNATIQGTVADIINKGLIELTKAGVVVLGQIHDEIIADVPIGQAEEVAQLVKQALTTKIGDVVLTVDVKIMERWG